MIGDCQVYIKPLPNYILIIIIEYCWKEGKHVEMKVGM